MTVSDKQPDFSVISNNGDKGEEPWYAGLNSQLETDARMICTNLMSHLGVGPRSRGAEYILSAIESVSDSHLKATCLAEAMEHLASDPSDYYMKMTGDKADFTSTHGFDHRAGDFYSALGIDEKGQIEVMKIMVEMSKGILKTIFSSRSLSAKKIGLVFEKVLTENTGKDNKIVAAAIYNLVTAPILRPVKFFPDSGSQELQSSGIV